VFGFSSTNKFLAGLLICAYSDCALSEIDHISLSEIESLKTEFSRASPPTAERLSNSAWSCSLFGVQTALQKLDRIQLYNFTGLGPKTLANSGSQAIRSYTVRNGELMGTNSDKALREDLRLTSKQELMGRLSRTQHGKNTAELVYSKCKQL